MQPAADASRDPPAPVQWLREEYHKSLHSSRSGSGRGLASEARNGQTADRVLAAQGLFILEQQRLVRAVGAGPESRQVLGGGDPEARPGRESS